MGSNPAPANDKIQKWILPIELNHWNGTSLTYIKAFLRNYSLQHKRKKYMRSVCFLVSIFISKNFDIHNNVVEVVTQHNDCKSDSSNNSFK